jgi:hypothetical protein
MDYLETFTPAYHFRLLYKGAYAYPIMGALRMTYGEQWEVRGRRRWCVTTACRQAAMHPSPFLFCCPAGLQVYRRNVVAGNQEEYALIGTFDSQPGPAEITKCFQTAPR